MASFASAALAGARAGNLPPLWLFAILAAPHTWYMWVLVHPASTRATAAWLRVADPVDWFAGVSLALNVLQFAALAVFCWLSPDFTAGRVLELVTSEWWRLPLTLPMFAAGLVFKVSIFTAIGKRGVYYGAKFGHTIPWVHGFPFSVTSHPQYLGSSLCISAVGLALHDARAPTLALLPAFWVLLYFLTGLAEEGLCHSVEPFSAMPAGSSPDKDWESRPINAAEAVRLAMMLPIVLARWAALLLLALAYIFSCRVLYKSDAARGRATRGFAHAALWVLGYSLELSGAASSKARVTLVANTLSYLDMLVLAAAVGPNHVAPVGLPTLQSLQRLAGVKHGAIVLSLTDQRCYGGCVPAWLGASVECPGAAALSYSAGNSFSASWLGGSTAAQVFHFYRLSAAPLKVARCALLPCRDVKDGGAAIAQHLGWPLLEAGGKVITAAKAGRGRSLSPAASPKPAAASPKPRGRAAPAAASPRPSRAAARSPSPLASPRTRRSKAQ